MLLSSRSRVRILSQGVVVSRGDCGDEYGGIEAGIKWDPEALPVVGGQMIREGFFG
jgi:hypothetical protein